MDDVEIRELFAKTCVTINEYQKSVTAIMKDIQKMNGRLKDMRLHATSEEMDQVIADYYGGIHDAGSLVDGLTERLKGLDHFVEVIDNLEGKVEQFAQIRDLLGDIEKNVTAMVQEIAIDKGKVSSIKKVAWKMENISNLLENEERTCEYDAATSMERLDALIEDMRGRIEDNKKILKALE